MGDILKDNPILSHILVPMLLIAMVLMLVGKPYVDTKNNQLLDCIERGVDTLMKNDSVILNTLKEI
jgi:hypothetical protein